MTPSCGEQAVVPVLFIDLEGGFGGSSRSMYYLIESLDRERFSPVAVVRKNGPIVERYKEIGIECHVIGEIPSFRPGERKRPVAYALYLFQLRRFPAALTRLLEIKKQRGIRIMHVNHESLGLIGRKLAGRLGLPWVCHIRTTLVPSFFARHVYRTINRHAQGMIFITGPNMDHFKGLVGKGFARDKAEVVYNITPAFPEGLSPLPEMDTRPGLFKVASLTNFSPNRGVDRIIDVAREIKLRGRENIVFYLFGHAAHTSLLGAKKSYAQEMMDRVKELGLEAQVLFPGHTKQPERVLAGSDALIKLTREANPWGRDIMEGLAAGLPVVTLGRFNGFVEHEVNGYLESDYRLERIAEFLIRLSRDPDLVARIRKANLAKAKQLFGGRENAAQVERLYKKVLMSTSS